MLLLLLLAYNPFSVVIDPVIHAISALLVWLTGTVTHNVGWSLVLLAALIKGALWPLSDQQYRSMQQMKRVQPKLKALQEKYKGDQQKLQQETMALYKAEGVNPLAGCLPLLLQLPILFSVYGAITSQSSLFAQTHWLWIGSPISEAFPKIMAQSLKDPDMILLVVYAISMFFSVRLSTPSMDPQMQQQQQIMAYLYPVMFGVIGRNWPSALILYWLTFNLFTMAQQAYLIRAHAIPATEVTDVTPVAAKKVSSSKSKSGARR